MKTGELHRLATYGSTARCAYAGTLGCWTQPKAIPIAASIARTRLRAYLSLRLVSTAHVQSARFFSLIRLVLSYSGEHDGTPIRSQGGEIIIRGNGQATERHALQREDGIFSQMVARFIEQMACLRRRPGASTRRLLLFADDRALHREKIACSRKERLLSRSQMNDLHVANIPWSKPSP